MECYIVFTCDQTLESKGDHCARKCCVLKAVFALAFTPSPLKLITCNKQLVNNVLLSSLFSLEL